MGRFTKWLRGENPRTGRLITERGTFVNQADSIERLEAGKDPFGNTWTAEYTPIIERKPLPAFSDLRDKLEGAGTADVVAGEIRVDATAGLTSLYTRDYGRYVPGTYAIAGMGVRFGTPGVGTYEYGLGNGEGNRVGMEVIDGEFYTFAEAGGDRYYRNPRSQWLDPLDGTGPSGLTLNESQHVLRVKMGWYGYLALAFYIAVIDRVEGERLILIDRSSDRDGVNLTQPDLPIFIEATGGEIYVGGRQFGVMGRYLPSYRNTSANGIATVGTEFTPLCSLRIKDTVAWRGVPVQLSGASILNSANVEFALIVGGTLTGSTFGSVPGIDDGETALEYDDAATAITGGYRAYMADSAGGRGNDVNGTAADIPNLQVPRDQVVTLAARTFSGTTDTQGILRLREEW